MAKTYKEWRNEGKNALDQVENHLKQIGTLLSDLYDGIYEVSDLAEIFGDSSQAQKDVEKAIYAAQMAKKTFQTDGLLKIEGIIREGVFY